MGSIDLAERSSVSFEALEAEAANAAAALAAGVLGKSL
jgi:hypothetical protein